LGNYVALKKLSPNTKQAQTTHAQSGAPHLSTWRYVSTSIDFFVFENIEFRQKSLKSRVLAKNRCNFRQKSLKNGVLAKKHLIFNVDSPTI